jgi:hypothetical protein
MKMAGLEAATASLDDQLEMFDTLIAAIDAALDAFLQR